MKEKEEAEENKSKKMGKKVRRNMEHGGGGILFI